MSWEQCKETPPATLSVNQAFNTMSVALSSRYFNPPEKRSAKTIWNDLNLRKRYIPLKYKPRS